MEFLRKIKQKRCVSYGMQILECALKVLTDNLHFPQLLVSFGYKLVTSISSNGCEIPVVTCRNDKYFIAKFKSRTLRQTAGHVSTA